MACHPQNVCLNPWDVQSKHIQTEDGVAEALYSGECRYGGGESYVLQEEKVCVLNDQGGDVIGTSEEKTGTLRAEDHGHPPVVYGLSPYDSNAMKSANPKAGIYEADTARTLDLNGASPVCNQGGMAVVYDASRRHDYKPFGDVCETVQAAYGTGGNNQPLVLESNQDHATVQKDGICTTLPASMGEGGGYVPMVVEGADLYNQEMTGDIAATMNASSCGSANHSGPSVCVYRKQAHPRNSEEAQGWEETDRNDTLNISDNTEVRTPTLVVYDARGNGDGETVPTLTGDHENRVTDYSAIAVHKDHYMTQQRIGEYAERDNASAVKARDYKDATDLIVQTPTRETVGSLMASGYSKLGTQEAQNGMYVVQKMWDGGEVSPTLTANNANGGQRMPDKDNFNAVVTMGVDCYNQSETEEQSKALSSAATDSDHVPCGYTHDYKSVGSVRRLTPLECTRLQGYPDHFVDIGDWVDSKGKLHKDADSPKYKALGNSIGLPWWQWLAYRIAAELKRSGVNNPTMASLFDGIGGFPFVFSKAGVKPVWASEIEEFPIAVTKIRFPEEE